MKCTSCTQVVKPFVSFDIDGTMADYHMHFANFAFQYWDLPGSKMNGIYDGSVEFEDWIGITKAQYREAKLAYRQGGMKRNMRPIPGAVRRFKELQEDGFEVWIATSRPWQLLNNIDPDTMEWLRRQGLKPDGIIYGDDKYERLVEGIDPERIVFVVDDLTDQIQKAHKLGLTAIQAWGYHNSHHTVRWTPGGYPSIGGGLDPKETLVYWIRHFTNEWRLRHAS